MRGPKLEMAVGVFLLLTLASLLVLAMASTNKRLFIGKQYTLTARFAQIGQLRPLAPVRIGGVTIGQVSAITLDLKTYESIVSLSIQDSLNNLPADTSAAILTSGLLGEAYVSLQPGGDPEVLKPGEQITFTQPAVDLIQLVGKYMFSGGGDKSSGHTNANDMSKPAQPTTEKP